MSRPPTYGPKPKCGFDPCDRQSKTTGLCDAHYQQKKKKTGILKPLAYGRFKHMKLDEFLQYTEPSGECMLWTRSKTGSGYGFQNYKNKSWPAHRLIYYLANGEPNLHGIVIHHKCANKLCVNPEHLQSASHAENVLEMFSRTSLEAELNNANKRISELEERLSRYEEV